MQLQILFLVASGCFSYFGSSCRFSFKSTDPRIREDLTTESNRLVKTSIAKNTWLTFKAAFESFNQRKQQQGTDGEVIKQWGCLKSEANALNIRFSKLYIT